MSIEHYWPAIVGALLIPVLAVTVPWFVRYCREPKQHLRDGIQSQIKAIGQFRIWFTISLHTAAAVALFTLLLSRVSILTLTLSLFCYVIFVCGLAASTLIAVPALRKLLEDPFFKIVVAIIPIVGGYVARGYAQLWVGEVLGTSAANVPMTLLAATAFMTLLEVGIALLAMTVVFEILYLIAEVTRTSPPRPAHARPWRTLVFRWHPLSQGDPDRLRMREQLQNIGLGLLCLFSFAACLLGSKAAFALPTSGLGSAMLHAIAFEFDAGPAGYCQLKDDFERQHAQGSQPFLKAIPLASSQEKALLVWRQPALFREIKLSELSSEAPDSRRMQLRRVEKCYEVGP